MKRWLVAALDFVPPPLGSFLSKTTIVWST
jgi:hypothetical protein